MAGIRFALLAIVTLLSVPTGASAAIVYSTGTSTFVADDRGQNVRALPAAFSYSAVPSPDGHTLLNVDPSRQLVLIDTATNQTRLVGAPTCTSCGVGFSTKGDYVAVTYFDGPFALYPTAGGAPRQIDSDVTDFVFSPDGTEVAYNKYDKYGWARLLISPVAGGASRVLPIGYANSPVWTPRGLVVSAFNAHGGRLTQTVRLINPISGRTKSTIFSRGIKRYRDTEIKRGRPIPVDVTGSRVVVAQHFKRKTVLRLITLRGRKLGTLTVKGDHTQYQPDARNARILVSGPGGSVQAISFKTETPVTLIPSATWFRVL